MSRPLAPRTERNLMLAKLAFWYPTVIASRFEIFLSRLSYKLWEKYRIPELMKFSIRRFLSVTRSNEAIIKSIFKEDDIMGRIFGIKPDQVHEFAPKGQDDIPASERTIFLVRFLDVKAAAEITDQVYTAKGFGNKREELLLAGTQELKVLQKSLVGWKNFYYEDGTEVEWEPINRNESVQKQMVTMEKNLSKISPERRGEIADFVKGSSSPGQD